MSFEEREHTADILLRIRAGTLAGLCEEAGKALMKTMYRGSAKPVSEKFLSVKGPTPEHQLHSFLSELLFITEVENLVFSEIIVTERDNEISAVLRGEPFDRRIHGGGTEVKGISWYGLSIKQDNNEYVCDVLFDV